LKSNSPLDKCRVNIAIIEPSSIICEGLSNILLQAEGVHYSLYYFDSLEEIAQEMPTGKIDLVIINPSVVKNDIKIFTSCRNARNSMAWVGILYSFFERETLELFDALIQITDSPDVISATIHRLMSLNCHGKHAEPKEQLTPRETDVLKHLVHGLSNKEIADQLNVSIHTVISHRKNIAHKTGIKSQAGLTIYAISNKFIDIEDYQG